MKAPSWEHFEHQADIGVRGCGRTVGEAFEQAALALTAVVTPPAAVAPRERGEMACAAPDLELLLVDWLNALVWLMATRRMLFARFDVRLDGLRLAGQAWARPWIRRGTSPPSRSKGPATPD